MSSGVAAARECLDHAGLKSTDVGMILVSSGSSERRFPGPASAIAHALNMDGIPSIDLPIASAGSLFGMAMAAPLAAMHGNVLVIASEKMSAIAMREPMERGVAPLFGDGAGASVDGLESAGLASAGLLSSLQAYTHSRAHDESLGESEGF